MRWGRGPEEEGPTGLPRREEGEGPGQAALWFRGTRPVSLGALQGGLLRHPVAGVAEAPRAVMRVRLLLGPLALAGPLRGLLRGLGSAAHPVCAAGSLEDGDRLPLGDGWA